MTPSGIYRHFDWLESLGADLRSLGADLRSLGADEGLLWQSHDRVSDFTLSYR